MKEVESITIYTGSNGKKGCSGNCIGCSQETYGNQHEMYQGKMEQIDEILRLSPNIKKAIILGNPDPSVDPEFCNGVAKKMMKNGIQIRFSASGKFAYKTVTKLIEGLDTSLIEYISFSIDTVEQTMLDYLKGTHIDLDDVEKAIKYLHKKGIVTKVQPTLWKINQDTYIETINYFEKIGVKWFSFHAGSFETFTNEKELQHITPKKWREIVKDITRICEEKNLKVHMPHLFLNEEEKKVYDAIRGNKCIPKNLKNTQVWLEKDYIRTTHCALLREVQKFDYNYLDEDKSCVDYKCPNNGVCAVTPKCLGKKLCAESIDGEGHEYKINGEHLYSVCRFYNYLNFNR